MKPDHKVIFLLVGFILAWYALFIMFSDFYEGLVQTTVTVVQGGSYRPYYLQGERLVTWLIVMAVSSVCLAIGLRAEEIH